MKKEKGRFHAYGLPSLSLPETLHSRFEIFYHFRCHPVRSAAAANSFSRRKDFCKHAKVSANQHALVFSLQIEFPGLRISRACARTIKSRNGKLQDNLTEQSLRSIQRVTRRTYL